MGDAASERKRGSSLDDTATSAYEGWGYPSVLQTPQILQLPQQESSAALLCRNGDSYWSSGACSPFVDTCSDAVYPNDTLFVDETASSTTLGVGVDKPSFDTNIHGDDMDIDPYGVTDASVPARSNRVAIFSPTRKEIRGSSLQEIMDRIPDEVDDLTKLKTARRIIRTTNPITMPSAFKMAKLSESARSYASRGLFVAKKNRRARPGRREREARRESREEHERGGAMGIAAC